MGSAGGGATRLNRSVALELCAEAPLTRRLFFRPFKNSQVQLGAVRLGGDAPGGGAHGGGHGDGGGLLQRRLDLRSNSTHCTYGKKFTDRVPKFCFGEASLPIQFPFTYGSFDSNSIDLTKK